MTIENIQELAHADYHIEIDSDAVTFVNSTSGSRIIVRVADFERKAIHISNSGEGVYAIGTTDLSDLEANGYDGEDPIEEASSEIVDGKLNIQVSGQSEPEKQYDISNLDLAVKMRDRVITVHKRQSTSS